MFHDDVDDGALVFRKVVQDLGFEVDYVFVGGYFSEDDDSVLFDFVQSLGIAEGISPLMMICDVLFSYS